MRRIETGSNISVPKEAENVGFVCTYQFCESCNCHYEGSSTCCVEVLSRKSQNMLKVVTTEEKQKVILGTLHHIFYRRLTSKPTRARNVPAQKILLKVDLIKRVTGGEKKTKNFTERSCKSSGVNFRLQEINLS